MGEAGARAVAQPVEAAFSESERYDTVFAPNEVLEEVVFEVLLETPEVNLGQTSHGSREQSAVRLHKTTDTRRIMCMPMIFNG